MKDKFKKSIRFLISGFLFILAFELVFSNRVGIALKLGGYEETKITLGSFDYTGKTMTFGTTIAFNGAGSITVYPEKEVYNIRLDSSGVSYVTVTSYITDENTGDALYKAGKSFVNPNGICIGIKSVGKASSVKLDFDSDAKLLNISSITLNSSGGFKFNYFRFSILAVIIVAAWLVYLFGINEKPFVPSKSKLIIALGAVLCLPPLVLGSVKDMKFDKYPFEKSVNEYTCYQQQADAFLKGQLNLDLEFDVSELEKLDNPYNYYERRNEISNRNMLWDRAYYKGKFYSYFGVVPVILCYVPICFITGYMPGDGVVSMLLTLYATTAIICALFGIVKYFRLKTNTLSFFFALPALCSSSLIYVLNVHPSMYYSAIISGITFFALTLFFSFMAGCEEKPIRRSVYLVLAGISVVLTVGSRPNLLVFCLMLVPLYIKLFFGKREVAVKTRVVDIVSLVLPVLAGACAIMWYNNARFSSPFDFGSTYQLTLADMRYQGIELYKFFPAIYHYFIQPPAFTGNFPYIDIASNDLGVYRGYHYIYGSVGALNFPAVWGIFGSGVSGKGDKVKKYTLLLAVASAIVVAFADFCMAGIHIRYMGDIMFPLSLVGIFVLLDVTGKAMGTPYEKAARRITSFILIASFLVSSALLFANEADNIRKFTPKVYHIIEMLFE